ncbi:MAG: hypothetical protein PW734_08580 [Verrucomicrobium sp.]|nr:hypothetical protein [Verrucomicrobium sp.]
MKKTLLLPLFLLAVLPVSAQQLINNPTFQGAAQNDLDMGGHAVTNAAADPRVPLLAAANTFTLPQTISVSQTNLAPVLLLRSTLSAPGAADLSPGALTLTSSSLTNAAGGLDLALDFKNAAAPANSRVWRLTSPNDGSKSFFFSLMNDALSGSAAFLGFLRDGLSPVALAVNSRVVVGGALTDDDGGTALQVRGKARLANLLTISPDAGSTNGIVIGSSDSTDWSIRRSGDDLRISVDGSAVGGALHLQGGYDNNDLVVQEESLDYVGNPYSCYFNVHSAGYGAGIGLGGDSGYESAYYLNKGPYNRWSMGKSSDAETGSSAGGNFFLRSYDDTGLTTTNVLTVSRATGAAAFSGAVSAASFSGSGAGLSSHTVPLSSLAAGSATNGQVLAFNGSSWAPGAGAAIASTGALLKGNGSGGAVAATAGSDYPGLGTANTFTTNQTVTGTVTATSFSGSGAGLTSIPSAAVLGATGGSSAAAGCIGEYVSSSGTVSLTSAVTANVTSVTLTPGDWEVMGNVEFTFTGTVTSLTAGIYTTSSGFPAYSSPGFVSHQAISIANSFWSFPTGLTRFLVTTNTVVYLNVADSFSSGTSTAYGTIQARRMR